jgi:hypothetical protein
MQTRSYYCSSIGTCEEDNSQIWYEIRFTVQQALDLDKKNSDTYWRDAIEKEMSNLKVAFDILDDNEALLPWLD